MFLDKLGLFHSLILVIGPGKKLWLLSVLRRLAVVNNEYLTNIYSYIDSMNMMKQP